MMRAHNFWKRAAILLVVLFLIASGAQYAYAHVLCSQIADGHEIQTSAADLSTAPIWFDAILSILQSEGVKIPLVEACYYRNVQAVKTLLNNGADPNFYIKGRKTPLEAALWNGPAGPIDERSAEIVQLLVEAGCDINLHASGKPALIGLSESIGSDGDSSTREGILLYLLDNGGQRDFNGYEYVFHNVIRAGNCTLTRKLITEYGFDVNGTGYMGQTPLILAVSYSQHNSGASATADMIETLLECGADKYLRDDHGKTAYDYAVG